MEPVAAIALFCNVLDLVEKTYKGVKKIKEIYDSTTGLSKDHERLLELINETGSFLDEVRGSRERVRELGFNDNEVQTFASNCEDFSSQITAILNQCRSKQPHSIFGALRSIRSSLREKPSLQRLQVDLEEARRKLHLVLTISARTQISHALQALKKINTDNENVGRQLEVVQLKLDTLENLPEKFQEALELCRDLREIQRRNNVLKKLSKYYNGLQLNPRYDEVRDASANTFQWIFHEPEKIFKVEPDLKLSFVDWLRKGRDIFHILGKPGSGKSTLMKFIWKHEIKKEMLKQWAGESRLLCLKYFFWRAEPSQSGLRGLKCSLVASALEQAPELFELLFPISNRNAMALDTYFGYEQICYAFKTLMSDPWVLERYRIFILIDGLDEFNEKSNAEDHYDLVRLIQTWTAQPEGKVKVCVSSREYDAFTAMTRNQKFRLQNLTRKDIQNFVTDRLREHPKYSELEDACREYSKNSQSPRKERNTRGHSCDPNCLIRHIVNEAEGVFLWVRLVMLEIRRCFECNLRELWELVDAKPKELTKFLKQILDSIPSSYQRKAYIMLAIAYRYQHASNTSFMFSTNSLSALGASYLWWKMGQDNAGLNCQQFDPSYSILQRCKSILQRSDSVLDAPDYILQRNEWSIFTAEQVNARFNGLLEISPGNEGLLPFTHRSIIEVLGDVIEAKLDEYGVSRIELGKCACLPVLADIITIYQKSSETFYAASNEILKRLTGCLKSMELLESPSFMEQLDHIDDICMTLEFGTPRPPDEDWRKFALPDAPAAESEPGNFEWGSFLLIAIRFGFAETLPWIQSRLNAISVPKRGYLERLIILNCGYGFFQATGLFRIHPDPKKHKHNSVLAELLDREITGVHMIAGRVETNLSGNRCHITILWIFYIRRLASLYKRYSSELDFVSGYWMAIEVWLDHGASPQLALSRNTISESMMYSSGYPSLNVKVDGKWYEPISVERANPIMKSRNIDAVLSTHFITLREFVAHTSASNKKRLLELIDRNSAWIEEDEAANAAALFEELPSPDILEVPEYVPSHKTWRIIWRAKLLELYETVRNIIYYIIGIFILATLAQLLS